MSPIELSKEYPSFSISYILSTSANSFRTEDPLFIDEKRSCLADLYVKSVCEIGYLCSVFIGIVESVFWSAIAFLVKLPHLFIPSCFSCSDHIYAAIISQADSSVAGLCIASTMLFYNLFANDLETTKNEICVYDYINSGMDVFKNFSSYHLC